MEGGAGADVSSDAAADAAPFACSLGATTSKYAVRFDQVGYLPEGSSAAVVLGAASPAPKFQVIDLSSNAPVASGVAGPRVLDTTSRAGTRLTGDRIDLSALVAGQYQIVLEDGSKFGPVRVDANAYASVVPNLLRFFGAQRCGPTTMQASQHAACHRFASIAGMGTFSGDGIAVDDGTTGTIDTTTGPAVDVEGGWHDAGDYIKFVGTTSFTLAVDLLALRDHPAVFAGPRAGSAKEALRAEMRWGLDWLVKMLGGAVMYHQVSGSPDHDVGWRIPEADTMTPVPPYTQRPVFRLAAGAGGNLLGRSAAALALGSQVFSDDPSYAAQLLTLARTVYAAGTTRPTAQSPDPPDFYLESSVDDDLSFGSSILAQITGDASYAADALARARALKPPSGPQPLYWGDVTALAFLETGMAYPAASAERAEMAQDLASLAAPIQQITKQATAPGVAFGWAVDVFDNGSLEQSLGSASVCLAAARMGGNAGCAELARSQLHYLFGQNPFGLSFLIGEGCVNPTNVHHALAQAARIKVFGAVVGGPTSLGVLQGLNDSSVPIPTSTTPFAPWSTDAELYEDDLGDYVVNEPAIDFTAPLVFDLGELLDTSP